MTTRDSHSWIAVAMGAWVASLASNPDAIEKMLELDKHAWVSALCQLLAIGAAFMKASPLPISDEGREKYRTDTIKMDHRR